MTGGGISTYFWGCMHKNKTLDTEYVVIIGNAIIVIIIVKIIGHAVVIVVLIS